MILIACYGHSAYAKFASNLSYSIRKWSNIPIALLSDGCHHGVDMSMFDKIIEISTPNDPCIFKISLDKLTPFERTIYLDADMLCLNNPEPLFEKISKGNFWIDCIRQTDENWWARSCNLKKYGCDSIFNDVNSSIMYFSKQDEPYFGKLRELYTKIDKKDLKNLWGKKKFIPDEVLHSILLKDKLEPLECVHYCDNKIISTNVFFLSMYGYGISTIKSKMIYDQTMREVKKEYYKLNQLYKHKFVGV